MKRATNRKNPTSEQPDGANRKLIGQIEFLQLRVAAAEETWKQAKEHFSLAKRRRKLARLFAKRAKKDAKRAAANLDLVRKALADAKTQAMTISWRAPSRKGSKAKDVVEPSKKRSMTKRPVRKTSRVATKPLSPQPVAATAAHAASIPGDPDAAASLGTNQPGEVRAIA